ncbi:hypothetical protein [Bdellovibrio sp. BCCA]|uniref:hypothetical protein n=1 Tax=Bdellovibrio sp. BCCA TaxID=3136281 RepID=UPI0030F162D0
MNGVIMNKATNCNVTGRKSEKREILLARLNDLKRGADHDSPLALSPWERDFINQLSKKVKEQPKWTPSTVQIEKINELWDLHFE